MFVLSTTVPNDLFQAAYFIFTKYAPLFIFGAKNTLIIALSSTVIGLVLGLGVGIIRTLPIGATDNIFKKLIIKLLKLMTSIYVEVFRGTPMMVQAVFIYYSLNGLFSSSRIFAGIFIVSINTGAYMAEIVRSGIQSLDSGQNEAARSLGMSNFQTMLFIILPQAIRNAFPAIGNEFVVNIKDTSVLNIIGISELFFQANSIAGTLYKYKETFFVTACVYLFLTYSTTLVLKAIEKKMNMTGYDGPSSSTTPLITAHFKGDFS
jgi:putative lysine transport system permease protein